MEQNYGIEITLVSCGTFALYNAYLPGNKHAARLTEKIEDVYLKISEAPLHPTRYYLQLELGGAIKGEDDVDF